MQQHFKYLLLFLASITCTSVFASQICYGDTSDRELEYKNSNLVFLGKISESNRNDNSFQFEILEVFKGLHPWNKITIVFEEHNGNRLFEIDEREGYWIVYAKRESLNKAIAIVCGASRNILNKDMPAYKISPPPEFFASKVDSLEHENLKKDFRIERQEESINEVILLKERSRTPLLLLGLLLVSLVLNIILINKRRKS